MTEPLDLEPIRERVTAWDGRAGSMTWWVEDTTALLAEVVRLRVALYETGDWLANEGYFRRAEQAYEESGTDKFGYNPPA